MKTKGLFLAAVMACLSILSMNAKSIYYVKVDGTGDGTSWSNAAGNIQDMIDKAAAGDEVWVAAGIYIPTTQIDANDILSKTFLIKNGVNLYGGFAGNEASIDDRAKSDMDGNGKVEAWEFTNETNLSGKLDGTTDVWTQTDFFGEAWRWTISGSDSNCKTIVTCGAEVIDETIFDGFTISDGYGNFGILTQGNTVIQNCIVAFNSAGISNIIGIVTNSHIYINAGRGVYNGTGTISNCTIEKNAIYYLGNGSYCNGGVYNSGGDIVNCIIMNNQVIVCQQKSTSTDMPWAYGGGIYNIGKIDKCFVMNNTVLCYNIATSAAYSSVAYMSANANGGGICSGSGGVVSNCCVFNNKATAIKTSNLSGTTAYAIGGGIAGGTIYNSTMANNMCNNSANDDSNGGTNCLSRFNLNSLNQIFVRPSTFVGSTTNQELINNILNSDWRLKEGSQYIDAGSLDNLPDWVINGTDLAGNPRVHDGKISRGAYEYDPSYTNIKKLPVNQCIRVSPSPATDFVTISGLQPNEMFYIYNINGQQLLSRKASGETEQIAVSHLPTGIYLLKTNDGQMIKWVKK
ncbi:MAG: T9SS type A sorting domain-containing protein [Candidatus Azobacteroides sp.]|nr:T9SS type A sorting domain-containing protein [Candidatus Azobacteroides sp.]